MKGPGLRHRIRIAERHGHTCQGALTGQVISVG